MIPRLLPLHCTITLVTCPLHPDIFLTLYVPLLKSQQYYSVFDPFTSLMSMPDTFSILGTVTEPRGKSNRALISDDYPMVGYIFSVSHFGSRPADLPMKTIFCEHFIQTTIFSLGIRGSSHIVPC